MRGFQSKHQVLSWLLLPLSQSLLSLPDDSQIRLRWQHHLQLLFHLRLLSLHQFPGRCHHWLPLLSKNDASNWCQSNGISKYEITLGSTQSLTLRFFIFSFFFRFFSRFSRFFSSLEAKSSAIMPDRRKATQQPLTSLQPSASPSRHGASFFRPSGQDPLELGHSQMPPWHQSCRRPVTCCNEIQAAVDQVEFSSIAQEKKSSLKEEQLLPVTTQSRFCLHVSFYYASKAWPSPLVQ